MRLQSIPSRPVISLLWSAGCCAVFVFSYRAQSLSESLRRDQGRRAGLAGFGICQISDDVLGRSKPNFAYEEEGDRPALVFCTVRGEFDHHPGILIHDPGGWRIVEMSDDAFDQSTWVYVGASRDRSLIWGVADVDVEDPGWDLEIVFSGDAGKSWTHIATVQKPIYLAWLHSFQMEPSGQGWLTVYLDDVYAYGRGRRLTKGYYRYFSRDQGKHWSGPQFSRRKPGSGHQALIQPSFAASAESDGGMDELKVLMRRMVRAQRQ